jgi:hypothetical protein
VAIVIVNSCIPVKTSKKAYFYGYNILHFGFNSIPVAFALAYNRPESENKPVPVIFPKGDRQKKNRKRLVNEIQAKRFT